MPLGQSDAGPHPRYAEAAAWARRHRGPWWWRLRVWASQHVLKLGSTLEPDDKGSTHWYSDDGQTITFATVRRPR